MNACNFQRFPWSALRANIKPEIQARKLPIAMNGRLLVWVGLLTCLLSNW